ncbi:hypothetical protein ElyMa_002477100, partial [Elysia marginata]
MVLVSPRVYTGHGKGWKEIRTADLVHVSPTQKLLDQVKRLHHQKSELLIQVSQYEELLASKPSNVKILAEKAEELASSSTHDGQLRSAGVSE